MATTYSAITEFRITLDLSIAHLCCIIFFEIREKKIYLRIEEARLLFHLKDLLVKIVSWISR